MSHLARLFLCSQSAIKLAGKNNIKKLHTLVTEEKPKVDTGQNNRHNEHHIKNNFKHNHYANNSILTPSTLNQVIGLNLNRIKSFNLPFHIRRWCDL